MSVPGITQLSVAGAYDRWAAFYDSADNPMVFAASRVLAGAASEAAGRAVFEFGCGTGRNLGLLKAAGAASVAGCDLSQGMLDQALSRDPSFDVVRHDMMQPLPRPAASADLVLFCLALEHAGNLEPPLAAAKRLLRPGGAMIILEIHPFVAATGVAAHFRDGTEEIRMPAHAHRFCDYIDAFAAADLRITACREWRPLDLGPDVPSRVLKRGAAYPIVVEWRLA